jgi:hypothetical protein
VLEGEGAARRTIAAVPSPALSVPARLHASLMARLALPYAAVLRRPAAGVRKPPREKTAIGEGAAVPRGRYGDLSATAVGANGA